MTDEENEAIEWLKRLVKINKRDNLDDTFAEILLNLIEKQQKEIEENKENWLLAQNELLGYVQGYEDGKKHTQTATSMIVENRQYEILGEEIKKYKNIIEKQSKEIEELKEKIKTFKIEDENIYLQFGEITEKKRWKDKIKAKIEEVKDGIYDAKIVLQSLLDKE